MQSSYQDFWFRRLHSLSGVVAVGLFLLEHLFTNSTATNGAAAFNQTVANLHSIPYLVVVESVFIFLPLLYHGVYGLYIAFTAGYNATRFGWFRNWMFVLQRITGVITFVFVIFHLYTTRFSGNTVNFQMVADIVSNPLYFWFMIIGVVSAIFHFANGLWSFCVHWGWTVGPRAQRVSAYVFGVFFLVLAFVGVNAILAFTHQA
ncbi:MAG: succinate dehydrogenase [Bacilli bacterium]|nr:succinate dehydrogenase [Bacilli bacterium]